MENATVIPKAELIHGAYYVGHCRNATVARWNGDNQRFYYWRTKFGSRFLATLPHQEDESGFDFFTPTKMIKKIYVLIAIPFNPDAVQDG